MDWKSGSRKRALTADEADLWTHTMRDAKALRRRGRSKKHAPEASGGFATDTPAQSHSPASPPKSPQPAAAASRPPQAPPPPPPLAVYDEKERRRLGKSPELIDARLDLHGFRQREAHAALRSFLFASAVRGHRHVLIITGKGTAAERQRDVLGRDFLGEERGVLRRLVPQWLGDPELRGIVVSYAASHIRHGGEGALYVRLRKAGAR